MIKNKRYYTLLKKFGTEEAVAQYMRMCGAKGGKSDKGNAHKKGFATKPYIRKSLTIH